MRRNYTELPRNYKEISGRIRGDDKEIMRSYKELYVNMRITRKLGGCYKGAVKSYKGLHGYSKE